jgi:hypothetical protein
MDSSSHWGASQLFPKPVSLEVGARTFLSARCPDSTPKPTRMSGLRNIRDAPPGEPALETSLTTSLELDLRFVWIPSCNPWEGREGRWVGFASRLEPCSPVARAAFPMGDRYHHGEFRAAEVHDGIGESASMVARNCAGGRGKSWAERKRRRPAPVVVRVATGESPLGSRMVSKAWGLGFCSSRAM